MVGVNVAADPLFSFAYSGVNGGMILVSADDPGCHSSQNEQDNRHYAKFAKIAMVEPSDSQEAKDMVKIALEISEQFDTPVIMRITTRICHSKSIVELGCREETAKKPYARDIQKYDLVPATARKRRVVVEERLRKLAIFAELTDLNRIEWNDRKIGIVTSGNRLSICAGSIRSRRILSETGLYLSVADRKNQGLCRRSGNSLCCGRIGALSGRTNESSRDCLHRQRKSSDDR